MQALILQPGLNVDSMDFFNVICDGQLVDPESDISEAERMPKKEPRVEHIGDEPVDQHDQ